MLWTEVDQCFPLDIFKESTAFCPFFSTPKCALPVFPLIKMHPAHTSAINETCPSIQQLKLQPPCFYAYMHFEQCMHCSKQPFIAFIFNLEHYLELFTFPLPLLQVCTAQKFQVLGFTNSPFNHLHIINENIFLRIIYFYVIV